jgi:hypothetical protein
LQTPIPVVARSRPKTLSTARKNATGGGRKQKAESRKHNPVGSIEKAECRKQKAVGSKQKAVGRNAAGSERMLFIQTPDF